MCAVGTKVTFFALFLLHLSSVDCAELPILDIDLGNFSLDTLPPSNFISSLEYNEDSGLTFPQLTEKYGYPTETHTTTTADGYILTLFRIPRGKNCASEVNSRPVVMMHGLVDSSDTFIIGTPAVGPAYLVADACYDVWCPNHRGNSYSRGHLTLNTSQSAYWNFTFDEHGMYDLAAIVEYVLQETGQETLDYIGHSQGSTDFLILTSKRPEYNSKINVGILLAPVAWMKHIFSPLLQVVSKLTPELIFLLDIAGPKELFKDTVTSKLLTYACQYVPKTLCGSTLFLLSGLNPARVERSTISAAFGYYPESTSTNNLAHFGQAINVNKFQQYDFGTSRKNRAVYGQSVPPQYDLSKVTAKVYLVRGDSDWLVSETDVDTLRSKLPNVVEYYLMPDREWSHIDFVWGKYIPRDLMPKLIEYLQASE